MTFWVARAGKHGDNEEYALEKNVVAIGWEEVGDLSQISDKDHLQQTVMSAHPHQSSGTLNMWTGELWAFKERMQVNDWIALPLKSRSAIAIGQIAGAYKWVQDAPEGAKHQRKVKWTRTDIPRSQVDQDLLYSLGSSLTVFRVKRNNAEERLSALARGISPAPSTEGADADAPDGEEAPIDLEQFAADQIIEYIGRKFRGHEFSRLVASVLTAEGYQVLLSPPGADGGVDIMAGSGPMGFDRPRIAVQVKSSDDPTDVRVVRELQGVMPRFGADQGLVVSWGGFKDSVLRESRHLYFTIRLWDAGELVEAIKKNYQRLPANIQAELPLKQLWGLVLDE
ncbi:MAG TPA: restriction endonuclease [Xanthobacteraceae bacterium]|nr:restriction endonuclease [Xanthobacteraceae bacterium]